LHTTWTHLQSFASPTTSTQLLTHPTTLAFHLSSTHFLTTLHICLGLPHPTITHLCHIDDLGIHLIQYMCENEHIVTHNTIWDNVIVVSLKNGAHVYIKVSHLFSYHTWLQINILITKHDFQTLANVITVDSTYLDIVQCASSMTMHVATSHVVIVAT